MELKSWIQTIDLYRVLEIVVPVIGFFLTFLQLTFRYYKDRKDARRIFYRDKIAMHYEEFIVVLKRIENYVNDLKLQTISKDIKTVRKDFEVLYESAIELQVRLGAWSRSIDKLTSMILLLWKAIFLLKVLRIQEKNPEDEVPLEKEYEELDDWNLQELKKRFIESGYDKKIVDSFKGIDDFYEFVERELKYSTESLIDTMANEMKYFT